MAERSVSMNNQELLSSIVKTAQMGQTGIRSVINYAHNPDVKQALKEQLTEYDAIEKEALQAAGKMGWSLEELNPSVRFMADRTAKAKMILRNSDSAISEMMINGNTKGIIKGLRNLHRTKNIDPTVQQLADKLYHTESDNIQSIGKYL